MSKPAHCLNCYVFSLSQRKAKVLVAGADWSERAALAHALEARGYTVLTARTGREAAELLRRHSPDLSLVDLGLEDFSEPGVLDAVRILAAETRLLAWCSRQEPGAPGRLAGIGATEFLLRPLSMPEVEALIDDRVAAGRARGSREEWVAPPPKLEASSPLPGAPPEAAEPAPSAPAAAEPANARLEGMDPLERLLQELRSGLS